MANHAIPRRDVRCPGTDLEHDRTGLVAEQVREKFVRTLYPIDLAELGSAETGGMDFDQCLTLPQAGNSDLVHDERNRSALPDQNGGGGFHSKKMKLWSPV
jgi:hypothetical protein